MTNHAGLATRRTYTYMTRVAEVCESESYAEAAKDAKWRAEIEEEVCALAENET